ncbi:MAG: UDP-N-acetylmuramate--L-alanine ligase [Bacteroidales bacterium]|nr:UDP-N-acetylmuramate--L-alanine ligase [Bacteroidales bacterium]
MNYYFLGIGGIGMSAIARFFHQRGDTVSGYDRTESPLTRQLVQEGIAVHYDDDPSQIPDAIDLVVYTPAVPKETAEFQYLLQKKVPMQKRSQVLGELTRGKKCIAVAGTHGKTSTSSMIAHILSQTKMGCSAFLGGIAKNFDSNMVVDNQSEYVVVEADEYDRSFLQLHPFCSVITATDPDHLDIYGTYENMLEAFRQFASQTQPGGTLILKEGLSMCEEHHSDHHQDGHGHDHQEVHLDNVDAAIHSYTAHGFDADYYSQNVRNYNGNIYFDLRTPKGVIYDLELTNTALYSVENAVAAAAAVLSLGVSDQELREGLSTYKGVRRRFDYHIKTKNLVMIDDYAHHPQEIAACLESVRYLYPGKRLVVVFQPHLYSRTRDFADEFARVLSNVDELIMMPIYPAREQRIPGVSSSMVLHKVKSLSKYLCSADQVLELVPVLFPDVVVTMGAGDIDRLVPRLEEVLAKEA